MPEYKYRLRCDGCSRPIPLRRWNVINEVYACPECKAETKVVGDTRFAMPQEIDGEVYQDMYNETPAEKQLRLRKERDSA